MNVKLFFHNYGIILTVKAMKVLGLVLELNPLHNGHQYFIDQAKQKVNPDLTVAVISTNFTMRGDISVIDKFTKTKLALASGIDVVLELPFLSAVNSADYFGYNALKILTDFGITDLAFGVEIADYEKLTKMKTIIDSDSFNEQIKKHLSLGLSYSTSAFKALSSQITDQEIINNFTLPNNTLGIQYLRAIDTLKKDIKVTLIKRIDNNFFDQQLTGSISSATAIRKHLEANDDISAYVPNHQLKVNYIKSRDAEEHLLTILKHQYTIHHPSYFQNILGVSEGIENRIANFIFQANSYQELIYNIQTKRYPINKIKRLLLHIILNTNKDYEGKHLNYLRLLGANDNGLSYLNQLPKEIKNIVITSFKKNDNDLVLKELQATKLYGIITKQNDLYLEEFKIPILGGKQ